MSTTMISTNAVSTFVEPLPPVARYQPGTILTLWMRGHSRTNGVDYFTPAMVLDQYADSSIDAIVFDTTSGVSFAHAYRLREESVDNDRNFYIAKENVGKVLFEPEQQFALSSYIKMLEGLIVDLQTRVLAMEQAATTPSKEVKKS